MLIYLGFSSNFMSIDSLKTSHLQFFETQCLIVSCLNLLKLINGLNKISKKLIASKNK